MSGLQVAPSVTGGPIVATDTVGGLDYQSVKLVGGGTGVATPILAGHQVMASSLAVVIASDQTAIPVTLPVVTGPAAKAAALPVTMATDQPAIAVTVPVGHLAMAASAAVVIASDQTAIPVTLPVAVGPAAKAAALPVTMATDQTAIPVTLPVVAGPAAKAAALPVTMATDQPAISVNQVSSSFDPGVSFARPADTVAYTAGDVVGGAQTFAVAGAAGSTMITGSELEIDLAAIPSGMTSYRLHLYNVTPPSALADNSPWTWLSGDRASYLGYIDLGTPALNGGTLYIQADSINKQRKLLGTNVYGYLVTNGAYTPTSSEAYKVTLHAVTV